MITIKGSTPKMELAYGARGKSAYQVAVDNGFEGTEKEWLDSLIGPAGPAGADSTVPGPAGKDGYTPVKGVDYFDGTPGRDGKDGKDGTVTFEELTDEQKASLKGEDYVLTEADKTEIADIVLSTFPVAEEAKW